jgi:hypothetical protein
MTNLLEWLADDRSISDQSARRLLQHGATYVERPAFSNPSHIDYLIGKSCFLVRAKPSDELDTLAGHVGYAMELDDHQLAVVALRRMTARGA